MLATHDPALMTRLLDFRARQSQVASAMTQDLK